MRYVLYTILILALGGVLVSGVVIYPKFQMSASLSSVLSFLHGGDLVSQLKQLQIENEALKAQIFRDTIVGNKIKVYSTYPFNNPRQIAISAGAGRVKVGDVITANGTLFVGRVSQVFSDYSIVDTIFDSEMKIEVRVGTKEADALFTGGNNPTLTLLSNNAGVVPGDIVFTAQKDYFYGLEVGRVKTLVNTLGDPVKRAEIEPSLNLKDLRDVEIHVKS